MPDKRPFFPPSSRILVGVATMIVSLGLMYGQSRAVQAPLDTLVWFSENRSLSDSAAYASAAYHAAYASEIHRRRWQPSGYMTLGTAGAVFGAALALSAFWRRRLKNPEVTAA